MAAGLRVSHPVCGRRAALPPSAASGRPLGQARPRRSEVEARGRPVSMGAWTPPPKTLGQGLGVRGGPGPAVWRCARLRYPSSQCPPEHGLTVRTPESPVARLRADSPVNAPPTNRGASAVVARDLATARRRDGAAFPPPRGRAVGGKPRAGGPAHCVSGPSSPRESFAPRGSRCVNRAGIAQPVANEYAGRRRGVTRNH